MLHSITTVSANATMPEDRALIRAIAQGDGAALATLYECHGPALLAYLVGMVGSRARAEELLQEVMVAVWQAAPRFRGDSSVKTWLFTIARNRALNAIKRQRVEHPLDETMSGDSPSPADSAARALRADALHHALRALPADQRETVALIFFHQLTAAEAARVQGVAEGTIKSRLHRAKAALRDHLSREAHDA